RVLRAQLCRSCVRRNSRAHRLRYARLGRRPPRQLLGRPISPGTLVLNGLARSRQFSQVELMLLIPAIDLRNGRCVRLFKGDFNAETRYEYDPLDLHERYRGFGATWLHVVDLDGAKDGVLANRPTIVRLAAQRSLRIQVGGGMRSAAVIEDVLAQGVERVVVGSAAIENPTEVAGWFSRF